MRVHLVPRFARRLSSAVIVATAAGAVGFAGPALADTSSIAVASATATPEQAIPVDLTFSGTNALTGNAEVEAVVRPGGGLSCLSSYQEDTTTFPGQDVTIFAPGARSVAPGAYSLAGSFKPPAAGSYQICAWLEQNQNSTDEPVAGPGTLTISARGPQVSQLAITVPKAVAPRTTFPISYTTQTDQQLSLYSVIYTAAQGTCPASFELNQKQDKVETVISGFPPTSVFGGPVTTQLTTRQSTGFYLVCTWVEGPSLGEVDGSASTPVTVGTPTQPKPDLRLTRATASHRHGVAIAGSSAAGFTGKLVIAAACGRATTRRATKAHNRRFASTLPLPAGCRRARRVTLTVSWAGSNTFAAQTVSRTVAIAR